MKYLDAIMIKCYTNHTCLVEAL